jgi:hypothetical protein
VGLTGVIYAAIVVAWAIFLVPLALRRHDQTARNRSIERFSSSMRVLSTGHRRDATSGVVVTSPPHDNEGARPAGPAPEPVAPAGASAAARSVSRASARAAAARRRRVLRVLVAVTCLTGAVSVLGVIPRWSVAVPLFAIAVFLVVARRQARRANRSSAPPAADARHGRSSVARTSAVRVDAAARAARKSPAAEPDAESGTTSSPERDPSDEEPTITLSVDQVAAAAVRSSSEKDVVATASKTSDGVSLWDPLPVTLPSYVGKPLAKRTVRKITIGQAGTWSSGNAHATPSPAAGSTAAPLTPHRGDRLDGAADTVDEVDGTDSAELTERPRAANA